MLLYASSSRLAHTLAQNWLCDECATACDKRIQVAHGTEITSHTILHQVWSPIGISGYDWEGTGHGLEHAIGHTFLIRSIDVEVHTLQGVHHLSMRERTGDLQLLIQVIALQEVGNVLVDGRIQAIAGNENVHIVHGTQYAYERQEE